ncbi:hypothetical protein [Duncaniella muris]|uniref:hypothetical protein n=1 Tax=Duncaniella muris TaxID=2094150 RepID=UPI00272E3C4B|nr:hypothetical protein [Duncaniella muris]
MKKDKNERISLTFKEADEIRELLETLFAMEGTLDEDFNRECKRAGFHARNMCELLHGHRNPKWEYPEPSESKYNPYE